MNRTIRSLSVLSIAGVCALGAATAFAFKEYCSWYISLIELDKGRSLAVSFFEHREHPHSVNGYVESLRESGAIVVTQSDMTSGLKLPPLKEGQSMVFVFEQQPDYTIQAHFPSPKVDLHSVEIDVRSDLDVVETVKANYTSKELANHPVENHQVDAIIDAYLVHYEELLSSTR